MRAHSLFIYTLILFIPLLIAGCKGNITVNLAPSAENGVVAPKAAVTNVNIANDQIVITGSNLNNVTNVRVTGANSFDETFTIDAASNNNTLYANASSAINVLAEGLFDLIITDAHGAATFPINISVTDGTVTAAKLSLTGAAPGDVFQFDGTAWQLTNLNGPNILGTWDANSNTPFLTDASGNCDGNGNGDFYLVSITGTTNIDGISSWAAGDWIFCGSSGSWERVQNGGTVSLFNDLIDVDTVSNAPTDGQMLIFKTGSGNWEPSGAITTNTANNNVTFSNDVIITGTGLTVNGTAVCLLDGTNCQASSSGVTNGTGDITLNTSAGSDDILFQVGSVTEAKIDDSGNFGIGATNSTPATALHVKRDDANLITIDRTDNGAITNKFQIGSADNGSNDIFTIGSDTTANSLVIDENGNIGINDTTPEALLDVNGTMHVTEICDEAGANCKDVSTGWGGSLTGSGTDNMVPLWNGTGAIDASGVSEAELSILDGATLSTAELNYVDGVTSAIQTQLNGKQASITTGTAAQYLKGDLTLGTFETEVNNAALTGYAVGADADVVATDTIQEAIEKIQGQIDANDTAIAAAGDITQVTTAAGSGLTGGVASGNANLQVIVDDAGIEIATNTIQLKDAGVVTAKVAAQAITDVKMKGIAAGCLVGQILSSDGAGGFACDTDDNGGDFSNGGDTAGANRTLGNNDSFNLGFETGGTTHMTISSAGLVGIGTNSPVEPLHIVSDGDIGEIQIDTYHTTASASGKFTIQRARGTFASPVKLVNGDNVGEIFFGGYGDSGFEDSAVIKAEVGPGTISDTSMPGTLKFKTTADGSVNPSTRIEIQPGGDTIINNNLIVGSDDTTADAQLHVVNDQNALTEIRIDNTNSGTSINHTGLSLYDGTTLTAFFRNNNNTNLLSLGQDNVAGDVAIYSGGNESLRVKSDGNIGIGTTNPERSLHIVGGGVLLENNEYSMWKTTAGAVRGFILFRNDDVLRIGNDAPDGANAISFYVENIPNAMYINGSGDVGIGTTSPDDALDVIGDVDATGCFQNNNTGTIGGTCVSDRRLKQDIIPLRDSLTRLLQLRPVTYIWRPEFSDISKRSGSEIGLIAQEVQEIFPDMVVEKKDGYKRVKYDIGLQLYMVQAFKDFYELFEETNDRQDRAISSLVAVTKEQQMKIDALTMENAEIKSSNIKLKKQVELMQEVLCELSPNAKICR